LYEQMFARTKTSKLAQRTLGALRLTRSFLLLEDDYDVDWEVDRDEDQTQIHPHRASLRGPGRRSRSARERRRAGELQPALQICLTPVYAPEGDEAGASRTRGPRLRPQARRSRH
jgi:hypothetical protein